MQWRFFNKALPNFVYALHDYTSYGFPKGETFTGAEEQKKLLKLQFLEKAEIRYKLKPI